MTEIWRLVTACPAYEVSSLGRVRRRLPGKRTKVGNILSVSHRARYQRVTLVQNGVRKYASVHCLVCEAFHGSRPSPNHHAAHLNGDNHDNNYRNLAWATAAENESHKVEHGSRLRGERVPGAKLTPADVKVIRQRYASGEGFTSIGRSYGVYYTTIRRIIQKKTWAHVAD